MPISMASFLLAKGRLKPTLVRARPSCTAVAITLVATATSAASPLANLLWGGGVWVGRDFLLAFVPWFFAVQNLPAKMESAATPG